MSNIRRRHLHLVVRDDRKDLCRCGHKREHHDPVDGRCNVIACGCWPIDPERLRRFEAMLERGSRL